jgi:hypothetical protein
MTSATWALLAFRVAAPVALKKLERDQEHEADVQGMLLMARAGYHRTTSLPCIIYCCCMKVGTNMGASSGLPRPSTPSRGSIPARPLAGRAVDAPDMWSITSSRWSAAEPMPRPICNGRQLRRAKPRTRQRGIAVCSEKGRPTLYSATSHDSLIGESGAFCFAL